MSALPKLPDVDLVRPVDDSDQACIDAVRAVLREHGALSRFGLTLLHSHFPVHPDEIMVERVDQESRTLTIAPAKGDTVQSTIETSWRLDHPEGILACETQCQAERDFQGNPYHNRPHYRVN